MNKTKGMNGITLVALVITIIVMLILVGVTISVAINGGLINRTKEAVFRTEIGDIEEAVFRKKSTEMAENNGKIPDNNDNSLDNLDISENIKNKYKDKLMIGEDWNIYYVSGLSEEEESILNEMNITTYVTPWYMPTEEELNSMHYVNFEYEEEMGSMFEVARKIDNEGKRKILGILYDVSRKTVNQINFMIDVDQTHEKAYGFIPTTSALNTLNSHYETLQSNLVGKWIDSYTMQEATTCPISLEDFEGGTIYSQSYLERVINSFSESE